MAVQEPPEQRVGWNVALDVLIQQRQIHRAQASPCLPSRLRLPPVTVDAAQNRTMGADGHRRAIPSGLCRYLEAVQLSQRGEEREPHVVIYRLAADRSSNQRDHSPQLAGH